MALTYRTDFVHFELQAQGREPRYYTDARQAGAALAAVRSEEAPQVRLHELHVTVSSRGEESYPIDALVAFTSKEGPPYRHVMVDHDTNPTRRAEFRAGYEEMRQMLKRSDVQAVSADEWLAGQDTGFKYPPPRSARQAEAAQPQAQAAQDTGAAARDRTTTRQEQRMEQQPNTIERGPGREPDIERATFSKKRGDEGVTVDLRLYGPNDQLRREVKGTRLDELEPLVGEDAAEKIRSAKGRAGTVPLDREPAPKQQQQASDPEPASGRQSSAEAEQHRRLTLQASLAERFVTRGEEYRFVGEPHRVAFVDKGAKLATSMDSPDVARGMVDLAEAKGWKHLHLTGSDEFRRAAWLEASVRRLETSGHVPSQADRDRLAVRLQDQRRNAIEQAPSHQPPQPSGSTKRQLLDVLAVTLREEGMDAKLAGRVMERAGQRLDAMVARGERLPQLQVYDKAASRTQQVPVQARPEHRERGARAR